MIAAAARVLLEGAIDYAGLFPPAQLSMAAAVGNYRRYLVSPERWALGLFVVPAAHLEEFAAAQGESPAEVWKLAVVGGPDPAADAAALAAFHQRHSDRAQVEVIEARTPTPEAVAARVVAHPGLTVYCELDPAAPGFHAAAEAARAAAARAKLRTGGVVPAAIPPVARVLAFLDLCHRLELSCKATAGLHHPLRGVYPLLEAASRCHEPSGHPLPPVEAGPPSDQRERPQQKVAPPPYAADAPTAKMHGFLNVMLAAAFLHAGGPLAAARHILERESAAGLRFESQGIVWQGTRWSLEQISAARRMFIGFGSCSFEEPLASLSTF